MMRARDTGIPAQLDGVTGVSLLDALATLRLGMLWVDCVRVLQEWSYLLMQVPLLFVQ